MTSLDDHKYFFDEVAADRPIRFIEKFCTHTKGPMGGKPLILEPWQRDIVRTAFGWKRKADGLRRYRVVYVEVPRKNGKSTLASGLALYLTIGDKEPGAKVFSCAGTRDQASLVFDDAAQMVAQCDALKERLKIKKTIKLMTSDRAKKPSDRGTLEYKAISADAFNAHGLNPSGIIFDELHVQKTRDLWDAMQTGTGAREQPFTFAVTTAGTNRASVCYEIHQHALRVRDGIVKDDSFLPAIFGADEDDDWTDPKVWAKANPNLGVSIRPEFLESECERAMKMPAYENTFRTLYLNQWVGQSTRWIPMRDWDACKGDTSDDELLGKTCFAGLDLASTRDTTSLSLVFPKPEGGYIVRSFCFIPQEAANDRARVEQAQVKWLGGDVTLTNGNVCDYDAVRGKLLALREKYYIQGIAIDPWNSTQLSTNLMQDGFRVFKHSQSIGAMTSPCKLFETLVCSHQLEHNGDPLLRWMVSNVAKIEDSSGNIKTDKAKSADKIDAVVATIMALGAATAQTMTANSIGTW
jgi:phage terminase large subunit-like protein